MADINKVWLSGIVVSSPVLTTLASSTPFCTFTVQVNERFRDRNGVPQVKANLIRVESLGKAAEQVMKRVKQGCRYTIDGYLRQDHIDNENQIRVRTFAVYQDETTENVNHRDGLKQALEILRSSRDVNSAIQKLEDILNLPA